MFNTHKMKHLKQFIKMSPYRVENLSEGVKKLLYKSYKNNNYDGVYEILQKHNALSCDACRAYSTLKTWFDYYIAEGIIHG